MTKLGTSKQKNPQFVVGVRTVVRNPPLSFNLRWVKRSLSPTTIFG
ncbi:hypothetical protein NSP_23550 [Nodularia spumigena CCY9414]|nr:hypothetical protein NSP_23550 [Nodularia spumigena CCY9414]